MSSLRSYADLEHALAPLRTQVLQHPVYGRLSELREARVFMKSHVFAVWDFMTLLKSLQRSLTGSALPWMPPKSTRIARMINEMVLGEESDLLPTGEVTSHFDLYLKAMQDLRAEREPIDRFMVRLAARVPANLAFQGLDLPIQTSSFVLKNLILSKQEAHQVAAAFFFAREDVIPQMFSQCLESLNRQSNSELHYLKLYLQRHIEVDAGSHGPLAQELLKDLCGADEKKWQEAFNAAQAALLSRLDLWDGIISEMEYAARPDKEWGRLVLVRPPLPHQDSELA
jgi:hypothetical protein